MGLLNFLNGKPRIPPFSVSVFGKLPCHREYLQVTLDAAFTPLKNALVAGVEELNRRGVSRPLIEPDRRFFVRMRGQKVDLAGCIWDSHDGQRAFPFLMAVPLPKRFRGDDQASKMACLLALWAYLEEYFEDLRVQPSDHEVYRRLRGVEHALPPVEMPRRLPKQTPRPAQLTALPLPQLDEQDAFLRGLVFEEPPSFIMLPTRKSGGSAHCQALIGFAGLADFSADSMRPLPLPSPTSLAPAATSPSEAETDPDASFDTAPDLDLPAEDDPNAAPTLGDADEQPVLSLDEDEQYSAPTISDADGQAALTPAEVAQALTDDTNPNLEDPKNA